MCAPPRSCAIASPAIETSTNHQASKPAQPPAWATPQHLVDHDLEDQPRDQGEDLQEERGDQQLWNIRRYFKIARMRTDVRLVTGIECQRHVFLHGRIGLLQGLHREEPVVPGRPGSRGGSKIRRESGRIEPHPPRQAQRPRHVKG